MVTLVEISSHILLSTTLVFIFSHTLEEYALNLTFGGITQLTFYNTLTHFGYVALILTWVVKHTIVKWHWGGLEGVVAVYPLACENRDSCCAYSTPSASIAR
jgi:hypothetical protein